MRTLDVFSTHFGTMNRKMDPSPRPSPLGRGEGESRPVRELLDALHVVRFMERVALRPGEGICKAFSGHDTKNSAAFGPRRSSFRNGVAALGPAAGLTVYQ